MPFWLRQTAGATGVLIYISLYEHVVRVLPDDAICEKVEPKEWERVSRLVIEGIRSKQAAKGLTNAILKCGELLASRFPIEADDVDELPSRLHFID
jgi:putative membrane protein